LSIKVRHAFFKYPDICSFINSTALYTSSSLLYYDNNKSAEFIYPADFFDLNIFLCFLRHV